MKLMLLLTTLSLMLTPTQTNQCETGYATLHQAWASVFYNFPERKDPNVDGYVAVVDCSQIGQYRWMKFGEGWYWVKIADCLNRSLEPKPGWLVDVSPNIWYAEFPYVPLGGHPAQLCTTRPSPPNLQDMQKLLKIIQ